MANPMSRVARVSGRFVSTKPAVVAKSAMTTPATADNAVVARMSVEALEGMKSAEDVKTVLHGFKLMGGKHHPAYIHTGTDGVKVWIEASSYARFRRDLADGTSVEIDAYVPKGCTCDMRENEVGDLVISHKPLRASENGGFFRPKGIRDRDADDRGNVELDGAVVYTPVMSVSLVAFNGHPVFRVANPETQSWAETAVGYARDKGTALSDDAIAAEKAKKIAELKAALAALEGNGEQA